MGRGKGEGFWEVNWKGRRRAGGILVLFHLTLKDEKYLSNTKIQ